jgi:dihydroorotate dehydrogenase electron transfer subunit
MIENKYRITKTKFINPDTCDMEIFCPEIAEKIVKATDNNGNNIPKIGTFIHIKVEGKTLRRPISIAQFDSKSVRIVFQVKGEGTAWLADRKPGEKLDIIGPLGNGFLNADTLNLINPNTRIFLVGGGIGIPPLLPLAEKFGKQATLFAGFRSKENVIMQEDFHKHCGHIILCTDDGTDGVKGFVTEHIKNAFDPFGCTPKERENLKNAVIFACGPTPMLQAVAKIANKINVPCRISLEERMGCGVGACLVCNCKVDGEYKRVCKDGPVFDSKVVEFV